MLRVRYECRYAYYARGARVCMRLFSSAALPYFLTPLLLLLLLLPIQAVKPGGLA